MLHTILDELSNTLEGRGLIKEAFQLDVVSNTIEKQSSTGFEKDLEEFNVPLLMKRLEFWKSLSKDVSEKKKIDDMADLIQKSKLVPSEIPSAKAKVKEIFDSIK